MLLIFYTYTRVVKVLWRIDKSIAWDENEPNTSASHYSLSKKKANQSAAAAATAAATAVSANSSSSSPTKTGTTSTTYTFSSGSSSNKKSGIRNNLSPNASSNNPQINYTMASGSSIAKTKMKNQLIARRKAAKMLICVALIFAICYLPIHLLNFMRFKI